MGKGLAIAFGSGGTRGLAALGVMTILKRKGIEPVAVSGSSVGGFIAAYYGVHGETDSLREWYEQQPASWFYNYVSKGEFRYALLNSDKMRSLLKGFIQNKSFEETRVPVTIVATDIHSGKTVFFKKGKMIDPIMASGSLPGIVAPVKINGRYYVDGGTTDPTPIDVFPPRKYGHVLGIDFTKQRETTVKMPSLRQAIMLSYSASRKAIIEKQTSQRKDCTIIKPTDIGDLFTLKNLKEHLRKGELAGLHLIRDWQRDGTIEKL